MLSHHVNLTSSHYVLKKLVFNLLQVTPKAPGSGKGKLVRKQWLVIVMASFGLFFATGSAIAAGRVPKRIPNPCRSTQGTYYNPDLFPIYEYRNQRLILKD